MSLWFVEKSQRILQNSRYYWAHVNEPSFHSWKSPRIKITKNRKLPTNRISLMPVESAARTGNKRTISTSKIRKMIASRKKRKEKGNRADFIGSNPHSKGELFSRSLVVRFANTQPSNITTPERIIAKRLLKIVPNISAKEVNLLC